MMYRVTHIHLTYLVMGVMYRGDTHTSDMSGYGCYVQGYRQHTSDMSGYGCDVQG